MYGKQAEVDEKSMDQSNPNFINSTPHISHNENFSETEMYSRDEVFKRKENEQYDLRPSINNLIVHGPFYKEHQFGSRPVTLIFHWLYKQWILLIYLIQLKKE